MPRTGDKYNWQEWKDVALKNNINKKDFDNRRRRGWSEEGAATITKGRDKHNWHKWEKIALEHGVTRTMYVNRINYHWSEEDAATIPKNMKKAVSRKESKDQYASHINAVYRDRECVFMGSKSECEAFIGKKYKTHMGELRIDNRTIIFDVE